MPIVSRAEVEQWYPILQFFSYENLPVHLQNVSKPMCELAYKYAMQFDRSDEVAFGLRKMLEAKDCMVRAKLITQI